jgi:hypothetical protein
MLTCNICNITANSVCNFRTHITTKKHIQNLEKQNAVKQNNEILSNQISQNNNTPDTTAKFSCRNCNKILASKFNLKRHFKTCEQTNTLLDTMNNTLLNKLASPNDKIVNNNTPAVQNANIMPSQENTDLIQTPEKGIVYFIQPVELIGTGRYKIGHSSKTSLNRCLDGYNRGSRYINIQECFEPLKLETKLKLEFKNKFKLIGGTEYFAGDERQMKQIFADTCELHDSAYSIFYDSYAQPPETNNSISQDSMPSTEADVTGSLAAVPTSINDL